MGLRNTTNRTIIASLCLIIAGGLLLVFGQLKVPYWLRILLTHTGSFIIASVAMALIFQYWQLRGLLNDLAETTRCSKEVEASGITGFSTDFHDGVPWDQLFQRSNRLNMMVAYASTWRNRHQQALQNFLSNNQSELHVVLPDPNNSVIMEEMALRFGYDSVDLQSRVNDALSFFSDLGEHYPGQVTVYFIPKALTFTFYRFNNHAVIASYRHRPNRGTIMTLTAERGGNLYGWIREEWYGIVGGKEMVGIAKIVYSSESSRDQV